MDIQIEEINTENARYLNQFDGEFSTGGRLLLHVDGDAISYALVDTAPGTKRYAQDALDASEYIDYPDKTIFFARVGGTYAGQIILRKYWNNYATIDDIVVDQPFRGQGVGKALIARAIEWACQHNLAGLTLETQDNNPDACQFYASCGFTLGGFDRFLYTGLNPGTAEIALYWYLLFE